MKHAVVSLTINGFERQLLAAPGATLLDVLRESQGLTGARRGCEQGACGTCTVLVDGQTVMSCLVPVETIDESRVDTIEGLTPAQGLHPIQEAFLEGFATQCGFCTSGMIMVAAALIEANPNPSRDEVIRAISGNVCRCTGYDSIIEAAARVRAGARSEAA